MRGLNFFRGSILLLTFTCLTACQAPTVANLKPNFDQIKAIPSVFLNSEKTPVTVKDFETFSSGNVEPVPLGQILDVSLANRNEGSDFITSLRYAINTDPDILSQRRDIEARSAAVEAAMAKKDFQVGTTVYGGFEDVTDNTKGLALALNASRLVYDGGKIESQIKATEFQLEAAKYKLMANLDERANELCEVWLDLEKYKSLNAQIDRRLLVLDPLIGQLEKVAEAGVGDISKVTAAQRTVSAIRAEKTSIAEGLAQAELEFANAFGKLDGEISFDYNYVSGLVPSKINDDLLQQSPMLKSLYASYQVSLERIKALKAKRGFDVGFEAKAQRPFAGSGYDSDESIGFVGRKTLYSGGMLDSEIKEAEALSAASLAQIKAFYRTGERAVSASMQNIESMEKAILISRENAKLTSDEILHLRQQLVIGGSTLDSVLTAEANLYEAESREIILMTEKYKSQVNLLAALGLLGSSLQL